MVPNFESIETYILLIGLIFLFAPFRQQSLLMIIGLWSGRSFLLRSKALFPLFELLQEPIIGVNLIPPGLHNPKGLNQAQPLFLHQVGQHQSHTPGYARQAMH
jgi:hypothetical protein